MTAGAAPGADALRLSGRPPLLAGSVVVANDTDRPLSLASQEMSLRAEDGTALHGALSFIGFAGPKEAASVPVHLVVDSSTPPGRYHGVVQVGEIRQPLDVTVLDVVKVTVSPRVVRLGAAAGEAVAAELSVSNDGNVPQELAKEVTIEYEEPDSAGRAISVAVRETAAGEGGLAYLDRFVRELRAATYVRSTAKVDTASATLAPGSQALVRISTTVPAELAAGSSYHGSFTFAGAVVLLEIGVTTAANSTKRRPA